MAHVPKEGRRGLPENIPLKKKKEKGKEKQNINDTRNKSHAQCSQQISACVEDSQPGHCEQQRLLMHSNEISLFYFKFTLFLSCRYRCWFT